MDFEYQDTMSGSITGGMTYTCMVGMTDVCGSSMTEDTVAPLPQPTIEG